MFEINKDIERITHSVLNHAEIKPLIREFAESFRKDWENNAGTIGVARKALEKVCDGKALDEAAGFLAGMQYKAVLRTGLKTVPQFVADLEKRLTQAIETNSNVKPPADALTQKEGQS